jgi:hypothetical protein
MERLTLCFVRLLLCSLLGVGARGYFFEQFDADWANRWTHSSESKYSGRFVVEEIAGLNGSALKARPALDLQLRAKYKTSGVLHWHQL